MAHAREKTVSDPRLAVPDNGLGLFAVEHLAVPGRIERALVDIDTVFAVAPGRAIPEHALDDAVAMLLAALTQENARPHRVDRNKRARAARRVIKMMNDSTGEVLSMHAICAELAVSLRTLERAFNERFGIGPKTCYQRLRLGRVRSLLRNTEGEMRVAAAAGAHGFWHLGQFATDFRRHYGELPSEMLRAASGV